MDHGGPISAECGKDIRVAECAAATAISDCEDGNPCTTDTCNAIADPPQCVHTGTTGRPCDDELACTSAGICRAGTCDTPVDCTSEGVCDWQGECVEIGCAGQMPCSTQNRYVYSFDYASDRRIGSTDPEAEGLAFKTVWPTSSDRHDDAWSMGGQLAPNPDRPAGRPTYVAPRDLNDQVSSDGEWCITIEHWNGDGAADRLLYFDTSNSDDMSLVDAYGLEYKPSARNARVHLYLRQSDPAGAGGAQWNYESLTQTVPTGSPTRPGDILCVRNFGRNRIVGVIPAGGGRPFILHALNDARAGGGIAIGLGQGPNTERWDDLMVNRDLVPAGSGR